MKSPDDPTAENIIEIVASLDAPSRLSICKSRESHWHTDVLQVTTSKDIPTKIFEYIVKIVEMCVAEGDQAALSQALSAISNLKEAHHKTSVEKAHALLGTT